MSSQIGDGLDLHFVFVKKGKDLTDEMRLTLEVNINYLLKFYVNKSDPLIRFRQRRKSFPTPIVHKLFPKKNALNSPKQV